jgi:hypothetical protein
MPQLQLLSARVSVQRATQQGLNRAGRRLDQAADVR